MRVLTRTCMGYANGIFIPIYTHKYVCTYTWVSMFFRPPCEIRENPMPCVTKKLINYQQETNFIYLKFKLTAYEI